MANRFNIQRQTNRGIVLDQYNAKGKFVQRVHWERSIEDDRVVDDSESSNWTPLRDAATKAKFLEGWKITGSGSLTGLILGNTLTVGGSAGSYTFQVPNTTPYINADTDKIWFNTVLRTTTEAELIGYDFSRTFVKYLSLSPYSIQEVWILKAGETLTTAEENNMRDYCNLSPWWSGVLSAYGEYKQNKPIIQKYAWAAEVADADGNLYTSITIGSQVWLVQNLKTTKYNDGSAIPTGLDNATWYAQDGSAGKDGAFSYPNNDINNKANYGLLYNWFALSNTKGITPSGFRIATQADFTTLAATLGGLTGAGNKVKEAGTTYWLATNGGTNSSGFSARGSGYRSNAAPTSFQTLGLYWTSNSQASPACYYAANNSADLATVTQDKRYGQSVRCVKI